MKISVDLYKSSSKAKGDEPRQLVIRVREGHTDLRCRTDILARPAYWDKTIPGYKASAKLPKSEITRFNKLLADITSAIYNEFKPECSGIWLRNLIMRFTDPKVGIEEKKEPAPAIIVAAMRNIDPTLGTLDKGSLCEWFLKFTETHQIVKERVSNYRVCIKKLRRFELFQRKFSGQPAYTLYCDTLTVEQLQDFFEYMENEYIFYNDPRYSEWFKQFKLSVNPPQKCSDNYKTGIMKMIRAFMNWMLKNGYTANESHKRFSIQKQVFAPPICLTMEERDKVYSLNLTAHPKLQIHRDIFIFQCMVGCRVGELKSFTAENISNGWLEYYPSKGNNSGIKRLVRVPLNEKAKSIINKYSNKNLDGKLFPVFTVGTYNMHIQMILLLAGITRPVWARDPDTKEFTQLPLYEAASSHLARKTFIGILYKKVKDPNLISSMTGHVEGSAAFNRYREIDDEIKKELVDYID